MASSVVNTSARLPISITRSAFSASMTAPGPTGIPAARSARAKPMTLSAIRPVTGVVMSKSIQSSFGDAPLGAGPGMTGATIARELALARRFLEDILQRVALHPSDIILVFQQCAERV